VSEWAGYCVLRPHLFLFKHGQNVTIKKEEKKNSHAHLFEPTFKNVYTFPPIGRFGVIVKFALFCLPFSLALWLVTARRIQ
jgi:hypothetical protein